MAAGVWHAEDLLRRLHRSYQRPTNYRSAALGVEGVLAEQKNMHNNLHVINSDDGRSVVAPGDEHDVATVAAIRAVSRHLRNITTESQFVAALAKELKTKYPGLTPVVDTYCKRDATHETKLRELQTIDEFARRILQAHESEENKKWRTWIQEGGECPVSFTWTGENLTRFPPLVGLPRLERLNLSGCTSLTDPPDLASAPTLQLLDLSGCTSLTDPPDLAGASTLNMLDLSGCTSLKKAPRLAGASNLRLLHLSGCTSLTDPPDLAGASKLKTLDLRGCTRLEKAPDLAGAPELVRLDLGGCTSLTNPPDLAGATALQILDLVGCTSLECSAEYIAAAHQRSVQLFLR